jgi:hypothetical protein
MIIFLDGPAAGVNLDLRRSPIMLRVVQDARGNWDALDQLDDEPKPGESIHVYKLAKHRGTIHICARGRGKNLSGWYQMADYGFFAEQPGDQHTRTAGAWAAWCKGLEGREAAKATEAAAADAPLFPEFTRMAEGRTA